MTIRCPHEKNGNGVSLSLQIYHMTYGKLPNCCMSCIEKELNQAPNNCQIFKDAIKEKTAQEMFEELGYIKSTANYCNDNYIIYDKEIDNDVRTVTFAKAETAYNKKNPTGFVVKSLYGTYYITKDLYQAINKQLEELKWFE